MSKPNIFKHKNPRYKYGIMFYNFNTEHEMRFYFYAHSAFLAARGVDDLSIPGYSKGEVVYINDPGQDIEYNDNLFDFFKLEDPDA